MAIVSVLGMHRSGTSCLAGALQEAGLYAGETSRGDPYNARGNREHLEIRFLHNDVLEASGGDWSHPPERLVWTKEHEDRRDRMIATFSGQAKHWTFKDPRTLLLLQFWRQTASEIVFLGIFRHPVRVARSLGARGAMSLAFDHGIALWIAHNRELLEVHGRQPFPLLCFDDLPAAFAGQLERAVTWVDRRLDFDAPLRADAAASFYERSLIHQDEGPSGKDVAPEGGDGPLLRRALDLYEQLRGRSALA